MIQLGTLFIGDFATELQELRRQHQIAKTEFIETKTLALSHWNSIEEKEEIFLDNAYYDVVSYKIENGFVYLEAVRDTFDINFKIALKNIIAHKNLSNNGKKKSIKFISPSIINENYILKTKNTNFTISNKPVVFTSIGNSNKINPSTFRPPCYFV